MRVQLAAVSDADAALETVTSAAAAVAQEMADPWRCEQCAIRETSCRRAGPSGNDALCNGASLLGGEGGRGGGKGRGEELVRRGPFRLLSEGAAAPEHGPPEVLPLSGARAD